MRDEVGEKRVMGNTEVMVCSVGGGVSWHLLVPWYVPFTGKEQTDMELGPGEESEMRSK